MKNILLVFGGQSVEHDISILTALTYSNNYMGEHKLASLYISKSGEWFFCEEKLKKEMFYPTLSSAFMPVRLFTNDNNLYVKSFLGYKKMFQADVAINCCHGGEGERGELNYIFSRSNIAISSATSLGLAIAMDKSATKQMLVANKLLVVPWRTFDKGDGETEIIDAVKELGFPVIVKPNSLGSSIGVEKVENVPELAKALKVAFEFDNRVIVEKVVENVREFNCACLRNEKECLLSNIDEPIKGEKLFTFTEKYLSSGGLLKQKKNKESTQIDLPEKLQKLIQQLTKKVVKVLDLYGVMRIDFLFDSKKK